MSIREKEKERITITGGRLGSNNFSSEHTTLTNQIESLLLGVD